MLVATLTLDSPTRPLTLEAELWNISGLARESNYDFWLESRQKLSSELCLERYPRWCESTRGLVARCLALTRELAPASLPADWARLTLTIGIKPGGRGTVKPLSMVTAAPGGDSALDVGFAEDSGQTGFLGEVPTRELYTDPWSLAEHALRVSVFGVDALPAPVPIELPVHLAEGGLQFVCTSDIPEPTRSVFEKRMSHSTRPLIPGHFDAVYVWDWTDFLGGAR